jgi:hypothetical protein
LIEQLARILGKIVVTSKLRDREGGSSDHA